MEKPWLLPPHLRTFLADPISISRPIDKEIELPLLHLNLHVEHTTIKGVKKLEIDFLRIYRDLRLSKTISIFPSDGNASQTQISFQPALKSN